MVHNGSYWIEEGTLAASDGTPYSYMAGMNKLSTIGTSRVITGTWYGYGAFIFVYADGYWSQEAELTTDISTRAFGSSVAGVGSARAIVGDHTSDEYVYYGGIAVMFHHDGGSWTQEAILEASGIEYYSYFGWKVAGCGGSSCAAVAAPYLDGDKYYVGKVFVFERVGNSGGLGGGWRWTATLEAANPYHGYGNMGYYGLSGIDGNTIIASTTYPYATYMFQKTDSGNWTQTGEFFSSRLGGDYMWDGYGKSIDLYHCNETQVYECSSDEERSIQLNITQSDSSKLCWVLMPYFNGTLYEPEVVYSKLQSACLADSENQLCGALPEYLCFGSLEASTGVTIAQECNVTGNASYTLVYYSPQSDGEVSVILQDAIYKVEPFAVSTKYGSRHFDMEAIGCRHYPFEFYSDSSGERPIKHDFTWNKCEKSLSRANGELLMVVGANGLWWPTKWVSWGQ